jgi:DNA-binding FrmR family transcriptional regulator
LKIGYVANKDQILTRLRRTEGLVRGIRRMVEEDLYRIDVLTHVSEAIARLVCSKL